MKKPDSKSRTIKNKKTKKSKNSIIPENIGNNEISKANIRYKDCRMSPDKLRASKRNPKLHPEKQIHMLMGSINQFGPTAPILCDEKGRVLAGHGRLEAMKRLKLKKVPVRIIHGLSKTEKRAYLIADNKLAQLGKWDSVMLEEEVEKLLQDNFNIEYTGFTTAEIDQMIGSPLAQLEDRAQLMAIDLSPNIVSVGGDLWICGHHRLYCGSALENSSYSKLLEKQVADLCFTDPPYNVSTNFISGKGKHKHEDFPMASGELSIEGFTSFLSKTFKHIFEHTSPSATIFSCMDWRHMREILEAGEKHFGSLAQLCVWVKDNGGMGSFYRSQHELVFAFRKGSSGHINNFGLGGIRYRTNVWSYPGSNTFKGRGQELLKLHPTVKPFSLVADAIRDCSHRNSIVLDPFCGSGTILVAAEATGRRARAIELDGRHVDTAVRRWQRFTGQEAILAGTTKTFSEISERRMEGK